jgi:flagellar hook-basal body complex protein FliE
LQTWQDISEKMNHDVSRGILASASDEIKKLIEDKDTVQKDIVVLFVSVANALDAGPFTEETTISDIQKEYPAFKKIAQNKIKAYEADLEKAENVREEFIIQKEKELNQITLDIERAKYVKQTQLSEAITKVLIYIGIFLGLLLVRYMSGRILARFQEGFSRPHKEAMWFIHRWSFRAIFLIAFLVLFSSEFSAFLPFIAIVATAIGFALRDVVYSFIGWFMIGASDGYEEGDIIQVEDFQGKVFKITPLLTTLEEHGIQ